MLGRGAHPSRWIAAVFLASTVAAGCTDGGDTESTAVTEPEETIAPPATLDTPALPVGTDTPGTEVADDEQEVADIPVALAVALRSYGDEWTSLGFVRGGDTEWPDLAPLGVDRSAASGSATVAVGGAIVTIFAETADSDAAVAALVDSGAVPIEVGGITVYQRPASRRDPIGAALSSYDVVGSAHGLFVVAAGATGTTTEQVAELASRPLAAWEASAVLSATALEPLFGAARLDATTGGLDPADAYRVAHPGASRTAVEAWAADAAAVRPPASPVISAAGVLGPDTATSAGRAVALYRSPEDATAAAEWIRELWSSGASYDGTATWADTFGAATVTTDGTVLTLDVKVPGEGWLTAPLPLAWAAAGEVDATRDTTGGTVSPAD